jgi:glutamate-5-semialdehyde dehydrogenase
MKRMNVAEYMQDLGRRARAASRAVARAGAESKSRALLAMAEALDADREWIVAENARDLEAASASGLDAAMVDRLRSGCRRWRMTTPAPPASG